MPMYISCGYKLKCSDTCQEGHKLPCTLAQIRAFILFLPTNLKLQVN